MATMEYPLYGIKFEKVISNTHKGESKHFYITFSCISLEINWNFLKKGNWRQKEIGINCNCIMKTIFSFDMDIVLHDCTIVCPYTPTEYLLRKMAIYNWIETVFGADLMQAKFTTVNDHKRDAKRTVTKDKALISFLYLPYRNCNSNAYSL